MTTTVHHPITKARAPWLIGASALLLLFSFMLLNIGWLHMHPDETLSYVSTEGSLADVIHFQISLQDNQAPGWFSVFWTWRQLMGDGEFASRVLGLLTALLALAVAYQIGRRAGGDAWAASLGIVCLIGNAFFFQYAYDIRPYPLVMLTTMLSLWAFQRWLAEPSLRRTIIYGVSVAAMLYVHYLLALFVVVHAMYLLTQVRLTVKRIARFVLAGVVAGVLFAPWFPVFVAHVQHLRAVEAQSGTGRGVAGIGVSTFTTSADTILGLIDLATNGLAVVYAIMLLAGVALVGRRRGWRLLVVCALGVPIVYLAVNLVAGAYAPRFISYMTIPLALALGAVLAALPGRLAGMPSGAFVAVALVAAEIVTFGAHIPIRTPYRNIYRAVAAQAQPGDTWHIAPGTGVDTFVGQQMRLYLPPALAAQHTPGELIDAAQRRIWFVTDRWLADDVQAAFRQLEPTHPLQLVLGDCNIRWCYLAQLMEAPPNHDPTVFGGQLGFYGIDIDHLDAANLQVRLWWRVDDTAPQLDYSIGLHLLDSSGVLVAQADGPINHYDAQIFPTSQMQPGQIYIDHRDIRLPANLPSGEYTLELVVYQPWDGVRLTLPDGADGLALDTLTLL
ncbi:MAG: glycosyltransferase family 39 protein [Anaerolineae bacterium]|nr:glycosyltransferase family 39 protein [Anaerolineae bacterium]